MGYCPGCSTCQKAPVIGEYPVIRNFEHLLREIPLWPLDSSAVGTALDAAIEQATTDSLFGSSDSVQENRGQINLKQWARSVNPLEQIDRSLTGPNLEESDLFDYDDDQLPELISDSDNESDDMPNSSREREVLISDAARVIILDQIVANSSDLFAITSMIRTILQRITDPIEESLCAILACMFRLFPGDPRGFCDVLECCTRTLLANGIDHLMLYDCIVDSYALLAREEQIAFGNLCDPTHPVMRTIFTMQQVESIARGLAPLEIQAVKDALSQFATTPMRRNGPSSLLAEFMLEQYASNYLRISPSCQEAADEIWFNAIEQILANCDLEYASHLIIRTAQFARDSENSYLIMAIAKSPFGEAFQLIHCLE